MFANDPFKTKKDIVKFMMKGERVDRLLDYMCDLNEDLQNDYNIYTILYEYFYSLYVRFPDLFETRHDIGVHLWFAGYRVTSFYITSDKIVKNVDDLFEYWKGLLRD